MGAEVTETPAHSAPHTRLFQANEEEEPEKKEVSELRSELWEKEMKLTDIRLEALNSAHQLDQLRETMHNMQLEVDLLKAENDRLKVAPGPSSSSTPGQAPGSSALSSPRRSLGLALSHPFSPSFTDTGTYLRRACVGRKRKGSSAPFHPPCGVQEVVALKSRRCCCL